MEIAAQYSPENIEQKWYEHWISNQLFESKVDQREPYTIVIPPPNVTGVLHMGHMLNNTIQDVLIRRARLQGKMLVGYQVLITPLLQQRQKWLRD